METENVLLKSLTDFIVQRSNEPAADRELYGSKGGISALTHALAVSLSGKVRVKTSVWTEA